MYQKTSFFFIITDILLIIQQIKADKCMNFQKYFYSNSKLFGWITFKKKILSSFSKTHSFTFQRFTNKNKKKKMFFSTIDARYKVSFSNQNLDSTFTHIRYYEKLVDNYTTWNELFTVKCFTCIHKFIVVKSCSYTPNSYNYRSWENFSSLLLRRMEKRIEI